MRSRLQLHLGRRAFHHVATHAIRIDAAAGNLLLCGTECDRFLHDLPLGS